jgi:hypothetical protein
MPLVVTFEGMRCGGLDRFPGTRGKFILDVEMPDGDKGSHDLYSLLYAGEIYFWFINFSIA